MPAIFVGHGSPMNAIEDNRYTREWHKLGKRIRPKAILMISAHWFTNGTFTQDAPDPEIINDMYGFPKELYEVNYRVKGSDELSDLVLSSISRPIQIRNNWGIDHGAWSVLVHMYPDRKIPVVQLSVDAGAEPQDHFRIGQELRFLRDREILVIGSGNIVHNLRRSSFERQDGYDWNVEFDHSIKDSITTGDHEAVLSYPEKGEVARLAVPTTDHFDPLFYVLGASSKVDNITVFNEAQIGGALSMTSYVFE